MKLHNPIVSQFKDKELILLITNQNSDANIVRDCWAVLTQKPLEDDMLYYVINHCYNDTIACQAYLMYMRTNKTIKLNCNSVNSVECSTLMFTNQLYQLDPKERNQYIQETIDDCTNDTLLLMAYSALNQYIFWFDNPNNEFYKLSCYKAAYNSNNAVPEFAFDKLLAITKPQLSWLAFIILNGSTYNIRLKAAKQFVKHQEEDYKFHCKILDNQTCPSFELEPNIQQLIWDHLKKAPTELLLKLSDQLVALLTTECKIQQNILNQVIDTIIAIDCIETIPKALIETILNKAKEYICGKIWNHKKHIFISGTVDYSLMNIASSCSNPKVAYEAKLLYINNPTLSAGSLLYFVINQEFNDLKIIKKVLKLLRIKPECEIKDYYTFLIEVLVSSKNQLSQEDNQFLIHKLTKVLPKVHIGQYDLFNIANTSKHYNIALAAYQLHVTQFFKPKTEKLIDLILSARSEEFCINIFLNDLMDVSFLNINQLKKLASSPIEVIHNKAWEQITQLPETSFFTYKDLSKFGQTASITAKAQAMLETEYYQEFQKLYYG
jgi:hypothetical protein